MRPRLRRRTVVVRIVAVTAAVIALVAVAGLPVYVFPVTDDAHGVDAVMVLGPPEQVRFDIADQIVAENGGVPLVVSAPATGVDSVPVLSLCREPGVICRTPDPFTTEGEALLLRQLASEYGWQHVAVITATHHISRARFLIDRCWGGDVRMVSSGFDNDDLGEWVQQYLYQTGAFVKAFFTTC